jgi:uncharacterized protein (DUF4415 family)
MKTKMVRFTTATLPPLTASQQAHLVRVAALPDGHINVGDMPELTDTQLAEMKPATLYRPIKQQITARVDADVLAWLKSQGKGYQSRINAILRREMLEQRQAGR